MKYLLSIYLVFGLVFSTSAQGFKHPGMLHTSEDFERIKSQIAAGEASVIAGYNNLKANEWSQSTVGTWPVEVIKRGIAGDENYINAARGAHAAYLNALRWKISGDVAHANKAISILNSWAAITKALGGNTNISLASGIYGYEFANAAELMRDYSGWKASDFKKFQDWMLKVWYPYAYDFLIRRHGTWEQGTPGHYWSNWGLCNVLTVMSIGILLDDEFIYNQGIAFYKYDKIGTFKTNRTAPIDNDGLTEFIGNLVPTVTADSTAPLGFYAQMQESGRDQGHATMALGLAVDICETAWNQGDDLYGYMNDRLLAGIEYVAGYNSGVDNLPWTEYWYHDVRTSYANSWKQLGPNPSARGQFRPYWDRILGHYEGRKGIKLKYSHTMANLVVADGGAFGGTSGGYDHLGFSTLTCTRPLIDKSQSPISLKANIQWGGLNYPNAELNNVVAGRVLKLVPSLPAGTEDSGNWLWDTGATTRILEITANSSALYRVKYTDNNGIVSTQLFSISVNGDCLPDIYDYSVTSSNGVYKDTLISAKQYSKLNFAFSSSSWRSSYIWNTGETSSTKELMLANKDTTVSVTGTNLGGATQIFRFHINVETLGNSYKIENGDLNYGSKIVVSAGKSVNLLPILKSGMEGGSWKWQDGSVAQSLQIDGVQESKLYTVTYSKNGQDYSTTFSVIFVPEENAFINIPMDEATGLVAKDIWAGYDANLNSAAWKVAGINNSAIYFDGTANSYLQLANDFLSSINDFTISCWVNPDALDTWARVWDFGTSTDYNMFLTVKSGDGFMRFAIKNGSTEQIITTTKLPVIGSWSHLAVTKTGNLAQIYLNGTLVGSNIAMTLKPSSLGYTSQNYLGKSQWPDPMFVGTIDEFRVYNKGMIQSEIQSLMSKINPLNLGYSVDGGAIVYDSIITVKAGQNLILAPVFKTGISWTGGTWLWSDGTSTQILKINNVQESAKLSISYTFNGSIYTRYYTINCSKEVTATYIRNFGFDQDNNNLSGAGSGTNLAAGDGAVMAVNLWNQIQDGTWATASTYDYGYLGTFNGVNIPTSGYEASQGGALAMSAGWGNGVKYTQTVTLPAGEYHLSSMVYNANAAAAQGISLLGWIPDNGDTIMSTLKSFTTNNWVKDEVNFSVQHESTGKIQLGLQSLAGAGTASNAKIFIDYVSLLHSDIKTSLHSMSEKPSELKIYQMSKGMYNIKLIGNDAIVKVYVPNGDLIKQFDLKADSEQLLNLRGSSVYIIQVIAHNTISSHKIVDVY